MSIQFDGWIWFDEGSVFTAGPDDTLVVLGGTKSDKYWTQTNQTGPPDEVEFIGQYFDEDQNKWRPLNYAEGLFQNRTVSLF